MPVVTTMARVLLRARLVSHGGLKLVLDLNVRYLVPVTKDVGSIATEQVDVFFAVKVPHFAPFCPRVKLTRIFLRIQLKLNTALLSTVRPCVRPCVRHRRDISHFSHI